MGKILGIFFFLFTLNSACISQQFTVKFSDATANVGDTATINVTVDNFTNLVGFQFSVHWDSTKFKYGKITNINSILGTNYEFATPPGPNNNIKQGTFGFLWFNEVAKSLPNGSLLFTVKLKAVGAECDSTEMKIGNTPTTSLYFDEDLNEFNLTSFVIGKIKINGSNCNNNPPPNDSIIIAKAGNAVVPQGGMICIPIKVTNFEKVEAVQSKIHWDPSVLQFKEIKNAVQTITGNESATANGDYIFLWAPPAPSIDATLPDGTTFFEICFTAIGAEGSMSVIDLIDKDSQIETIFSVNGVEHPFMNMDGKVTINSEPQDTLTINIADVTVNKDNDVDVSFKVDNFKNIVGYQMAVVWDSTKLVFVEKNNDNVGPTTTDNLQNKGTYKMLWTTPNVQPKTLANGTNMFNLRFKAIGACDALSLIEIKDILSFGIVFIGENSVEVPYKINQGSAKITCGTMPTCQITAVNNITCNAANNGSINAVVTNGDASCQCIWKRNGVQYGSPLPISNCNLINLPPGDYTLDIVCAGIIKSTCTASIIEPPSIIIEGNVTNVMCGNKGSISVSITNAINPSTFAWSHGPTTKDVSGLDAGDYTLIVTDFNKCTSSKTFSVSTTQPSPLTLDTANTDVKCFGDSSGSISLNISGGCPDYDITWSGSTIKTPTRSSLSAGDYSVTVTDKSSPANSISRIIKITQPSAPISLMESIESSSGTNGSITLTVNGGTGSKTFNWTGPSSFTSNMQNISGLQPGTYNVTVTDANLCTITEVFNVPTKSGVAKLLDTLTVPSENINAGYGVSCVNICDGIIAGIVGNTGKAPYTITLSGVGTQTKTLDNPGSFQFDKLCTGIYTVRVTDSNNSSESKTIAITTPTIIRIQRVITCSDGIAGNGEIDLTVSGGAGGYTYAWSDGSVTEDIDNLEIGNYDVVVSDVNGCQQLLENISVGDCNEQTPCFEGTPIITPNNDGINDYFSISCALNVDNELFIYDRWGRLVYSARNYDNTWNGLDLDGNELKENGYMWVFNYNNNISSRESIKGTVTLLRK